jgi:hypothetical protein
VDDLRHPVAPEPAAVSVGSLRDVLDRPIPFVVAKLADAEKGLRTEQLRVGQDTA